MWDRVSVVTKPAADIITVADLKARLRIDGTAEDALLASLLAGAVARIDGPQGLGVAMMEQTWRLTLDCFPATIRLPGAPIKSVSTITYMDTDGVEQTLDAADYRADFGREPVRVEPAYGSAWPATRDVVGAVKIDYLLGEANAAEVPQDLIDAACLLVGHRYAHREGVLVGDSASELPLAVEWILNQHRRGAVA